MSVIAIYRPYKEKTFPLSETLRQNRDRPFMARFYSPFKVLIISILAIIVSDNFAKAQKTNKLCFDELVGNFLTKDVREISTYNGFTTEALRENIDTVSGAPYKLMIEDPEVNFENLPGAYFERSIVVNLIFQDTIDHVSTVTWTDTLQRKQIGEVRKSDYRKLRGTDPRFAPKYLTPALLVAAGISGIISLFYIRSS